MNRAKRIAQLEHALKFYADARRYQGPNCLPITNDPYQPTTQVRYRQDVTRDHGDVARKALLGIEREEKIE